MLRLRSYITKRFLLPVWFLMAALLSDGANLVDIIQDSNVVHTDDPQIDEDNGTQQTNIDLSNLTYQNPEDSKVHLSKQLYDQDSPSLEPGLIKTFSIFILENTKYNGIIRSFHQIRQLYIELCSLLI